MGLNKDQQLLLEVMRRDNQQAGSPFSPAAYWQQETRSFDSFFSQTGINDVENEYYNTRFHGTQPDDPQLYRWFFWTYYQLVKARDSLGLLDRLKPTLTPNPGQQVWIGEKKIQFSEPVKFGEIALSPDLLFTINDFYNLHELNPRIATDELIVADLGAGWGRLGHLLLQVNPKIHYVILDIPESLLISSSYLPVLLPHASRSSYMATRAMDAFDRETFKGATLWFLATQDLQRFRTSSVDFMVNIASFQEMPAADINRYLEIFDTAALGAHAYFRNGWSGKMSRFDEYRIPEYWTSVFFRPTSFSHDFYEAGYLIT
jgi:hypothetical protein